MNPTGFIMDDMTGFMHTTSPLRAIFLMPSAGFWDGPRERHAWGLKLERRLNQQGF